MDTHDVGRARDGVPAALRNVKGRIVGVGIPGDLLYDPRDVRRWTDAANAEYREVQSLNGHDGFLTEGVQVSSLVREVLGTGSVSPSHGTRHQQSNAVAKHAVGDVTADVVILGYGRIGRELATQLGSAIGPHQARVVAVIDRTGYVFDARGISATELADLARAKECGVGLAEAPRGIRGTAAEALVHVHRHTPTRPILVDVTAGDTGSELEAALAAGMDIVLANKRPLAEARGVSGGLARSAARHGRRMLHEATVGAGLPIIDTIGKLQESGDEVLGIEGCPSGTLGYLFGELGHGTAFSTALRTAMTLGYTEPDPREDLSGMDVARKVLILGRLIGFEGDLDQVDVESLVPTELRDIGAEQFLVRLPELNALWRARVDDAAVGGRVLRYRATVSPTSVRVGLTAVDSSSPLATLTGTDNQFAITTRRYRDHPIVITGPGAGVGVTAAGVLNDVLKLARSR
jgi:aspartokinase/homoserine dehydrogenase 1